MTKVFIDGSAGTTGLRIRERLEARADIELVLLPEALRKQPEARCEAIHASDIAFLCLPDDAAREAVALAGSCDTAIIDTSTAHRTAPGWVYGMAELPGQRARIAASKRVANPGCHASGFIALVAPLVQAGVIQRDAKLSCFSLTGYSGGGKKMIADYGAEGRSALLDAPRQYGLSQAHKHLPEMAAICGLDSAPVFSPIVADFYSGMEVSVPLFGEWVDGGIARVQAVYAEAYPGPVIRYLESANEGGFLSAGALSGRDDMEVTVTGSDERMVLTARFDNLGKGASGAAIQNMNILMGVDETTGLILKEA